jgi:prolyl 4-hydroxylase
MIVIEKSGETMLAIDSAWQRWLHENTGRGCTVESMVDAMVASGFDRHTATAAVDRLRSSGHDIASDSARTEPDDRYVYEAEAPIGTNANTIRAGDREIQVIARIGRPEVLVVGGVLTDEECEAMIALSRDKLRPSTIVDPDSGGEGFHPERRSEGVFFQRGENDFVARIEQRMSALMSCPVEHGEGLQVLHYGHQGEYRPHFDYFPLHYKGTARHLEHGGQRVATLVVYLNDVESGGETIFPEVGLSVVARRGNAVYFRYMNALGQLDRKTLHGGAPVLAGEKWIMTKWVRERPYI